MNSVTGPGEALRNALWSSDSVTGQTRVLWADPNRTPWQTGVPYRVLISHLPECNCRMSVQVIGPDGIEIMNSGWISDCSLKGGKLGAFVFSQQEIIWSKLSYKCEG